MKKIYRFICLVMALFILSAYIPPYHADAASIERYTLSEITAEQFINSDTLKTGLQTVIDTYPVAFTKSGEVCSKSHKNGESNCQWFTPHQDYERHNSRATQCFGYANFVYETIFGRYWDYTQYFESDGTLGSTTTGAKAKSEFERLGVAFGTIMRSVSAYHSFVVLKYDDDGIWIIHANYAGSNYGGCNTSVYHYTWNAFADAYDQISYIIIPDSICESCTYTVESFPVCTECSHRLGVTDEMYANYKVTAQANYFTIPFEGFETEEVIPADSEVIITKIFALGEQMWAKTEDGRYIRSGSLELISYIPTMKLSGAEYPDSYIINGKSFWLEGTLTSKNMITSLTVEILDKDDEVVDTITITPNRTSVDISDADNLQFSDLPAGSYTFKMTATDLAEEKVFIESRFRVISTATLKKVFPDENFRSFVKTVILGDADLKDSAYADLYDEVFASVTEMNVSGMDISSLQGIERFPALITLDASANHLTYLDLSVFEHLENVNVSSQTATVRAEYDRENTVFTAKLGEIFSEEYERGTSFPQTQEVTLNTGFRDLLMDITLTVKADMSALSDVNGDGIINSDDLSYVLYYYGTSSSSHEDVNYDGKVDAEDISILLSSYGK